MAGAPSPVFLPPVADWRIGVQSLWPPVAMALLCWLALDVSYLLFHTLAEVFSIVVAATAMVVASTSLRFTRNHFVVYVAVAIGWCAALDLLHTLSYKGMGLLPVDDADPPTQLWIAARFIQAVALVSAPWLLSRSVRPLWLHLGFGSAAALAVFLIAAGRFPPCYVEGEGLTAFKIGAEYLIIALLLVALGLFWRNRRLMSGPLFWSMSLAVGVMLLSEFAFTRYVSVYAQANMLGHVLKIVAYWFVYVALVDSTLRQPFGLLARAASTYDAVPDPTLIVDRDGRIQQANAAAGRAVGRAPGELAGAAAHPLFHDPAQLAADCPLCRRVAQGGAGFRLELVRADRRAIECSVAPFDAAGHLSVQVVRDISERQRLVTEREALIRELGERIKELRCTYAIAELCERPDLTPAGLLEGVARLLPTAFVVPSALHAAIDSPWGRFGADEPLNLPPCRMTQPIRGSASSAAFGSIAVWYDARAVTVAEFLPEEEVLLASVARHVGETLSRLQAAERVRRLSSLYEMLSATNRAVIHSPNREALLTTLFEALIAHGAFPMLFIALTETGALPLQIVRAHGIPPSKQPALEAVLADPDSPFARIFADFLAGRLACQVLADASPVARAADRPWFDFLVAEGMTQRALMPLASEGRLLGVVGLYARGSTTFDADQLRLLDEMASDLGFALDTFARERRRMVVEHQFSLSEHRFQEVFDASPLPMQIRSLGTRRLRAINRAHQQLLGYLPEEIAEEDDWFGRVFPDAAVRERLREHWRGGIGAACGGQVIESPELTLRCRDGSTRIARGTMTVIGDDVIIAWTDLTEIRRSEQTLRESEQRFRAMVEQTVSGVCVHRDSRFIYVNPRFCEMVGWPAEALVGQAVEAFVVGEAAVHAHLAQQWARLAAGERSISYVVPLRCGDGRVRELSLHATPVTWDDDRQAVIAMAEDITERQRVQAQLAEYVAQLEGSMKATLQAVSNMVELRDPYTAGHERRVGLIARAIATEMGWPAARCESLELIGLVHDIGKIAVPAEILSKPTRLSALEMALVREHAQAGFEILKDVPFTIPVAQTIGQHHERMDGSGYPQGLAGAAILPEARVLAVADVVESMASHRPYRAALGIEAALAEIEAGRGLRYDPEVVDALVRLIRTKGYRLPD